MAQKVTTHLVDDLTGDTIEDGKGRTITFGFDGSNYEMGLLQVRLTRSFRPRVRPVG
ncbi:Lsr2 dimerization domain-containing protein [Curtobacterium flaccumfaciens]|uniref:Lsr2 dimerization domain-containing protein n=1 Tax=Curtobacterium flaccumfaciens TaxID=2035 RepID=UPI00387A34ED